MLGTVAGAVGSDMLGSVLSNVAGGLFNGNSFGGVAATLMNPLNAFMNPLESFLGQEQKDNGTELKNLMREMITLLKQVHKESVNADIGGKETRPGDLIDSRFNPNMDQEINVYTGYGDHTVLIV